MKKAFLIIITFSVLIYSCETKEKKKTEKKVEITIPELTKEEKIGKLKKEASRLRGGGSVKEVLLIEDKAIITYVKNYSEYKKLNPKSNLTKKDINGYWDTGEAIEKALVDGSVRLMKKLDFLNEVEIILPYKSKTYSIDVEKEKLERYLGTNFAVITLSWNEKFSNPYVYDDKGRKTFFKDFGKVK